MLNSLIALALLSTQSQDPNAPELPIAGKITLGRETLDFSLPNENPTPYTVVNLDGQKYEALTSNSLGSWVPNLGGWADAKAAYKPAPRGAPWVKVVVASESLVIDQQSESRRAASRRSAITVTQYEEIEQVLGQVSAILAADGMVVPVFEIIEDDDVLVATTNSEQPGERWDWEATTRRYQTEYARNRVNVDRFQGDDPIYRGPYAAVFVIHATLARPIVDDLESEQRVITVPFWGTGFQNARDSLATLLAPRIKDALMQKMRRDHADESKLLDPPVPTYSRFEEAQSAWKELVAAFPSGQLRIPFSIGSRETLRYAVVEGQPIIFARRDGLVALNSRKDKIADFTSFEGGFAARLKSDPGSLAGFLEIPQWMPKVVGRSAPFGLGDFGIKTESENGTNFFRINRLGWNTRGLAVIARGLEKPLFDLGTVRGLGFQVRSKTREDFALNLHAQDGSILHSIQFSGESHRPKESPNKDKIDLRRVAMNGEWQKVLANLPILDGSVYALSVGPPVDGELLNRRDAQEDIIDVTLPESLASVTENPDLPSRVELMIVSPNQMRDAMDLLANGSSYEKLNALSILSENPDPRSIPVLGELARGTDSSLAWMALRLLADLRGRTNTPSTHPVPGVDSATYEIDQTILRSPFELNRQLALPYAQKSLGPEWLGHLNTLMTNRSWQIRSMTAKLFSRVQNDKAGLLLVSSLQDPDPNVRIAITFELSLEDDLASRRLVFQAVNDPNEVVRAYTFGHLSQSKKDDVIAEVVRAVRDESRLVRFVVVESLGQRKDEQFRNVFRIAVLDKNDQVVMSALRALKDLPEPVVLGEFANTLSSTHQGIQLGILELAIAKNIKLPQEKLDEWMKSSDARIRKMASDLGGKE
ncbi:MAG: HEAT repeat domain-containing protein [Armatimonadetes bacterium]|nr:HEAT repeat domain-containing protein [Armatimonadota bacterium]